MASFYFLHLPAFKFQLAQGGVARAHDEMMADGVGAAAGRSTELSPEVDWSGRRVGTILLVVYVQIWMVRHTGRQYLPVMCE